MTTMILEKNSQAVVDRLGRSIGAQLDLACENLPYDVTERLRAARVRAIEAQKLVLEASAEIDYTRLSSGALAGRHPGYRRWVFAGLFLVLIAGLLVISTVQDELSVRELADLDAAILTDDLPPSAYLDTGFAQFLKVGDPRSP